MRRYSVPTVLGALAFLAALAPAFSAPPGPGCGNVRLDSPGGTMEHVPVRDQQQFGICYAASASMMHDAFLLSHGQSAGRFQSSMIEGAIGSGQNQHINAKSSLEDGGYPCDVANYYKEKGACDSGVLSDGVSPLQDEFDFLDSSYSILYPTPDPCGAKPSEKESDLVVQIRDLLVHQSCTAEEAEKEHLAKTKKDLMAVLDSITKRVEEAALEKLKQACGSSGRKAAGFSSCEDSKDLSPKEHAKTKNFIEGYLNSKNVQPLGIQYCSNILSAGAKYVGLLSDVKSGGSTEKCDCGTHESVIIGKRADPKTGRCQFLIQNSWGTDCGPYSSDWQCENGKIWVDADTLSRNIENYSYLK